MIYIKMVFVFISICILQHTTVFLVFILCDMMDYLAAFDKLYLLLSDDDFLCFSCQRTVFFYERVGRLYHKFHETTTPTDLSLILTENNHESNLKFSCVHDNVVMVLVVASFRGTNN